MDVSAQAAKDKKRAVKQHARAQRGWKHLDEFRASQDAIKDYLQRVPVRPDWDAGSRER